MTQVSAGAARSNLRETVVARLRSAIADGSLAPGTHLAEIELSSSFDVSRATLREALRQVQQEGLLTQDDRGRLSVRRLTAVEVAEVFEVRLALETTALRRLCALPDRTDVVRQLRLRLDRLRHLVGLREDLDADLAFHEEICLLAGNETLHVTWLGLSGLIRVTMMSAGADPARHNASYERHAPLLEFVAAGDGDGVATFLEHHMRTALDLLRERMSTP